MAAVPGFRPRPARAAPARGSGKCPPGGQLTCEQQFGKGISECCSRPIPGSGFYTCCAPGECFYSPTHNTCCPKDFQCGKGGCCNEGERCVNEECVRCDSDKVCGKECCEASEVCANAKKSLCCVKTWKQCRAGLAAGVVKCCPPLDECCFNKRTKTAKCCDKQHPCDPDTGRCRCTKDETRCGDDCCKTKQGEFCCDKKMCCKKGTFCVGGKNKKTCCPSARAISRGLEVYCCPPGTVDVGEGCCPRNERDCCESDLACLGNSTCVRGVCQQL